MYAKQGSAWARKFFIIWTGQALSLLGSSLVQFAIIWWLTNETGSATVLSIATLFGLLPQILIGPFVGPLVDRLDRRRIMISADIAIAASTAILMLLFVYDRVEVWHIYLIMSARSLGQAFHSPAMASSTSLLVPKEHHTRISGLNQALHGLMNILAPPIGALLVFTVPMQAVLAIDLATAIIAVLPLLFLSIPSPAHAEESNAASAWSTYIADLKGGLGYVFSWPGLSALIFLAMMINFLLAPAGALMPLIITKVFEKGAYELALIEAVMGIGVILGGLTLSAWGGFKRKIYTVMLGVAGIGLGILMVGLAPKDFFALTILASFITGIMQVFANGSLSAILMSTVKPAMQGRVFSLLGAGATAMMPLSLMLAGPLSDWLGMRTWFIAGGCICIMLSISSLSVRSIMNIEENASALWDG